MQVESDVRPPVGQHLVQFYDGDDELLSVIGSQLAGASLSGATVVVVASQAHSDAFRAVLADAGVDVPAAEAAGRLVVRDAAESLGRCLRDGVPDVVRFDATVGALVRAAGAGGRRVQAYGEMVSLLWENGDVAGALELEALWNELAERVPFSLSCGYRNTATAPGMGAVGHVCDLHDGIVTAAPASTAEVTRRFGSTALAPRAARRFVADTLRRWSRADLVDDGSLVVAELATNAVVHARSDFTVGLSRHGRRVVVVVGDSSTNAPSTRPINHTATGGRGLRLVGSVTSGWGHDVVDGGKLVWAELSATGGASRRARFVAAVRALRRRRTTRS